MATLDRNGFVILNNIEEAFASSNNKREGGLPKNHIENPDEGLNPLGESVKAALRAAAAERKAARKAAKAAAAAAAAEKRAARRAESAINAQRLFKFINGEVATLLDENIMEEVEETLYSSTAEGGLKLHLRNTLLAVKRWVTLAESRDGYSHRFTNMEAVEFIAHGSDICYTENKEWVNTSLGYSLQDLEKEIPYKVHRYFELAPHYNYYSNVKAVMFGDEHIAFYEWEKEEFTEDSFETIWGAYVALEDLNAANEVRREGRFRAAVAHGLARPGLAQHYNIDPKAWAYIDRKAEELGLDPAKAYDSFGVWGLNPYNITKAWYAAGCKLGGKFRIWAIESLHTLKNKGRVDFEGPVLPKAGESIKSYKGRILFNRDLRSIVKDAEEIWQISGKISLSDRSRYSKLSVVARYYVMRNRLFIEQDGRLVINWGKLAAWLRLPKRVKAAELPMKFAWSLLFKRKAPLGLTDEDPHPTKLDRVSQRTFRALMEIVKAQSTDDSALAANTKAAYHLALGFRDIQSVKRWVAAVTGGSIDNVVNIHDAYVDANKLLATTNRTAWVAFLTQFPDLRWSLAYFSVFEKEFGRAPTGKREFVDFAGTQEFENIEDIEVARLSAKHGLDQDEFEDYQEFFKKHPGKKATMLPGIELREGSYVFRKLDDHDKTGPFLGLATDCCQHLHNAGSSCAKAGWKHPESGFYVVEKDGDIVAQSWAWRGKDGELCFDSIEGLGNISIPSVAELYLKAAKALIGRLGITKVTVGNTYYGVTDNVKRYLVENGYVSGEKMEHKAKMIRKVYYTDADKQWLLAD